MRSFFALALCVALAGRGVLIPFFDLNQAHKYGDVAMALNIVFGGALGNITASQLLAIPDSPLKTDVRAHKHQR